MSGRGKSRSGRGCPTKGQQPLLIGVQKQKARGGANSRNLERLAAKRGRWGRWSKQPQHFWELKADPDVWLRVHSTSSDSIWPASLVHAHLSAWELETHTTSLLMVGWWPRAKHAC